VSPIKRSPQLQPLSRDHHTALLAAFRIMHGLDGKPAAGGPTDFDALLAEAIDFHDQHFLAHAEAEETVLVPALLATSGFDAAGVDRLLADHRRLVGLIARSADASTAVAERRAVLREYGEVLERHVRFEERELFPSAERELRAEVLAEVGTRLAAYETERERSCRLRS
jgi:hemerythrin-like domain-containing protein